MVDVCWKRMWKWWKISLIDLLIEYRRCACNHWKIKLITYILYVILVWCINGKYVVYQLNGSLIYLWLIKNWVWFWPLLKLLLIVELSPLFMTLEKAVRLLMSMCADSSRQDKQLAAETAKKKKSTKVCVQKLTYVENTNKKQALLIRKRAKTK